MNAIDEKVIDSQKESDFPPLPLLENWIRSTWCDGLAGNVYGHPNFPDGELINTSPLKWINEPARLAETKSRMYRLGKRAA